MTQKRLRILMTGGGTGGHVYPLLEVYRLLAGQMPIEAALYVGARGRAEEKIVPRYAIPLRSVSASPVSGLNPWRLFPSAGRIAVGTIQALGMLLRFRPNLILASGGYVSAPVCFASFLLRPFLRAPLVVQEQNVMPGLMNRVASLLARVVMISFPETAYFLWNNRCVLTGYPVRREVTAELSAAASRAELGLPADGLVLLVYGGSLGSRSINRLVAGALEGLVGLGVKLVIVHSTGLAAGEYAAWEETRSLLASSLPPEAVITPCGEGIEASVASGRVRYCLQPYLHDIARYLAAADIVLCRAGAGAVSEIAAAGKASIVVPKRALPGDHQEHNAIRLAENEACEVLFERQAGDGTDFVDPAEFLAVLGHLATRPDRVAALGRNAHRGFNPLAGERIVATVRGALEGRELVYEPVLLEPASVRILKQVDLLVDFLRGQPEHSFYRRLYGIKMEECFAASDWHTLNKGIKLAGALRRLERVPDLVRCFNKGNGFMRRNVLRALAHMDRFVGEMPDLLSRALADSYFEVRAEALAVSGKYAAQLAGDSRLVRQLKETARRRFEHYEVRREGLRVLTLFVSLDEYLQIAGRYRFAENARLRQAILEGLRAAILAGRIGPSEAERLRQFISEIPITTSDFAPSFTIRDSFLQLYRALSEKEREREADRP